MASTSTSFVQKSFKYDVFLSFRGEDTRNTFVSHLYKALEQNGIQTYKDDEKIEKGGMIDTQLMESIEDSRFFIIVFSKDYAGSSWCLDELVKIMECQETSEQTAYPVFYDVEPTEIRNQSGAVKEAFKKHENKEAAGKWRKALNDAGNLAGWESKKTANGDESELIKEVVDDIFKKICSISSSVDGDLVGMETRIEAVLSSLELDAQEVRMIGIWGMGGGGKTTLAKAVSDQISIQFDGKAFVENVREISKSSLGLNELQQRILRSVLSKENITVSSVYDGTNMMKRMIRGRKVLVVLDDVDDIEQLEALAGAPDWFKLGSRVIITTRDRQVLSAHGVKFINDVNLLSPEEGICLFSMYAFRRDIPIEGYEELSKEVVQYADGLPLTIKVLGSLLCGQNVPQWKVTLERLKKIPLKATMEKLELSYNSLEEDYKEIFLDVACLLKGWRKDKAVMALESCGFFAEAGFRVLQQRSLINISEDEELGMHDHIEEMGKNIVRRVNPNKPEMHSRLWNKEEIKDILANDSGTQATECITLDADGLNCKILVKGLTNMKELRFLHVDAYGLNCICDEVSSCSFDEGDPCLPNALQFLSCHGYPFSSLPKTFQAKNLVGLDMYGGNMVQLWKVGEEKACLKLRFLKFTRSNLRTLDLSVAPNLETLILENCYNLVEVHFHVTPNLKELRIEGCDKLEKLHMPAESPELRSLDLDESSKLRTLHLGKTPKLETLHLDRCTDMVELCMPAESPKLRSLNLKSLKLTTLHLGKTPNLEKLILRDCNDIEELRMPTECPKLITLDLYECPKLKITPNLETLSLGDCTHLVELSMPAEFPKLVTLDLYKVGLQTLHLGITPNLEKLSLDICPYMVELHMPAEYPKLVDLHLHFLPNLRTLHLGSTPNLEKLLLGCCYEMVELCMLAEFPKLVDLDLYYLKLTTHQILQILAKCPKLVNLDLSFLELTTLHLGATLNLEKLSICDTSMVELHITTECPKLVTLGLYRNPNLKSLDLKNCYDLKHLKSLEIISCRLLEKLPEDIGRLQCLEELIVNDCSSLRDIPNSICEMDRLKCLDLSGCMGIEDLPEEIGCLECLEELSLRSTDIKNLPDSICFLKHLKSLEIISCRLLEKLPKYIGRLQCLEKLIVKDCILLRDIPNSICEMHRLKCLDLSGCMGIEDLPEEIGCLECLEELSLQSTDIKNLPDSICFLKHLKSLEIISCRLLEKLPKYIGRLQCLEKLIVKDCILLRDIPNSICEMHRLECLDLTGCIRIEEFPEEIGRLDCLKKSGCIRIEEFPEEIGRLDCLKMLDIMHNSSFEEHDDNDDDDVEDVDRGGSDDDGDDNGDDDDDGDGDDGDNVHDDDDVEDVDRGGDDDDGDGDDNGDDGDDDDDDDDDGDDGDNVHDDDGMLMWMLLL